MSDRRSVSRCSWLAAVGLLAACGGQNEVPPEYPPVEEPRPVAQVEPPEAEAEAGEKTEKYEQTAAEGQPEAASPRAPIQVVAAERTPIEGPTPRMNITSPKHDTGYRGDVKLHILLKNWELSPEGKHVHVIVDNEPYIAVRDVSGNIDLNKLVEENLGHELEPGTHVVRAFPSRAHHESVKESSPFDVAVFHYKEKDEDFELDEGAPLLTYSRPKGCNEAGERVLLDFYLANTELSEDGTRVRYTVDGETTGEITQWTPHYIENLPLGEHEVALQLIDAEGELIDGPFNATTRTISVEKSCEEAVAEEEPAAAKPGADEAEEQAGKGKGKAKGHAKAAKGKGKAKAAKAEPKGKAKGHAKGKGPAKAAEGKGKGKTKAKAAKAKGQAAAQSEAK